jgi:hypothetical protein
MNLLDRTLTAAGIDARRYHLLSGLFGQLAERREMMNQLGRDGITLNIAFWMYVGLGGICCLMFVAQPPSAGKFLGAFTLVTAVLLVCVLISEAGNSLVNPVEGVVLSHMPIDGATYTAAKLTHLLRVVAYLAPALNAIPAVASFLLLQNPHWYYPLVHLAATFAAGLVMALFACAIFGWLLRFVPPSRLKKAGQIVEALPFLVIWFGGQAWQAMRTWVTALLPADAAARRNLAIALAIAVIAVAVMGLRSLSADYLVRVSTIVHGGGRRPIRHRRSRLGDLVARWLGGQPARAGFAYTSRMMGRDWAFRRQLIPLIPCAISPVLLLAQGVHTDPFSGRFSLVHVIPHVFGVLLFVLSISLTYSGDHKGAWVFLLAPSGAFAGFARGVHGMLWFSIIGLPHLMLFFPLAWFWGIGHAVLFTLYSLAVATLYLGMELRLIDGVPFSKQPVVSPGIYFMGIMMGGALAIGVAVAIQYLLIFRSALVVAVVTALLAAIAWFVTRASLQSFAVAMRYNLGLMSEETGRIYQEVLS